MRVDIFGSGFSRAIPDFAPSLSLARYFGRQSLLSATSDPLSSEDTAKVSISEAAPEHVRSTIEADLNKGSLVRSYGDGTARTMIVDLLEERRPIGRMENGAFASLSQAAVIHSNLKSVIKETIMPFSDEHEALFETAVGKLASMSEGREFILLRAYYAAGPWAAQEANQSLDRFYSIFESRLSVRSVSIAATHCQAGPNHRWGSAPYHYIDAYYQAAAKQVAVSAGVDPTLSPTYSLQSPEKPGAAIGSAAKGRRSRISGRPS